MRGARPQVAGLQLRAGAAQERRLFLHPCCPCHPCPAHTLPLRPQPRRGAKGTTPGCRPPCALCITVNLGVGACPRVFLGRKELQGLGRELEEGCK